MIEHPHHRPLLEIENMTVWYPRTGKPAVLTSFSLAVDAGAFFAVVGPSGCGKSTLLHGIGGFLQAPGSAARVSGSVRLRGALVSEPGLEIGYVGQRYGLFNWLTIEKNIAFGLHSRKFSDSEIRRKVDRLLGEIGLTAHARSYPDQLSGGMQQRAALARAMAPGPSVLLLDEPFSALDTETRRRMQELLLQLWDRRETTIVFVTHDIDEALLLSDRILVLSAGGAQLDLIDVPFDRPRSSGLEHSSAFRQMYDRIAGQMVQHPAGALGDLPIAR
jgi:NitT/TauT family transport system ATP-binding protein